jgi:hypothetical protein
MADRYRDRPFPADDDYGREPIHAAQPQAGSDPLAELARLIGQADPFADVPRPAPAQPLRRENHVTREPAPDYDEPSAPPARPSWLQNLAARRNPQPSYDEPYEPPFAEAPPPAARGYEQAAGYGHAPHDEQPAYDPAPAQAPAGDRYDDVLYGRPDHDPRYDAPYDQQDAAYDDPYGALPPYDDGAEHEVGARRRGGTLTVVAVLLLAVVGTGAAFAYRTFIGSPRSGEPPIIKADAGPNKVVPAGAGGDAPGKQIYDRVGDKTAERVVSREEQPVDIRANANAGPRVVFPPLTQNANPPTPSSASPSVRPTGAGVGNGTLGGEEPRRIRTLSIRPDQPDAAAAPAAPAPRAQAPAAAKPAPAPMSTASTGAGAPVSLAPQQAQPEPRARVAAVNPAGGAGAYVQVSSQKTEADAQASFRALQGKYSGILGSRSALIRRADLGDRGVFYRAMVGPFASTEEATQFCVNLKSAGGQCVVQRN